MKRLFAALAMTAALLLAAPTALATSLELSVNAPPGSVRAGEEFTVTVELDGAAEFCAAQFTLAFDRDEMECVEAKPGPLAAGMLHAENPDAPEGAIVAAASAEPVKSGEGGVLGTFRFRAKADLDRLRLALEDVLLGDENGNELAVSLTVGAEPEAPEMPSVPETPPETPEPPKTPETPSAAETSPETLETSPALAFPDVKGHWAADSIRKAAESGLIGGYADGTFRPDQPVTRKQMAVILWRMAGKPRPETQAPFTDLEGCGQEFRDAIAWGHEKGLINGTSADTFSPDAALTRQAAMKLLFGYAGGQAGPEALLYPTYDGAFADSGRISGWAREAMYWGVYNGVLNGSGQTLNPRGNVTRAQLSAILVRYLERGET